MKIVLDTQGGDRPPEEIIRGGVNFALLNLNSETEVIFAGDGSLIEKELQSLSLKHSILHAPEIVTMTDNPLKAVRQKKQSSLVRGIMAIRDGVADAFVSPANSGAVMAASLLFLRNLPKIERPGIGVSIPTLRGKKVLIIDAGANAECSAFDLLGFALMGKIYCEEIWGIKNSALGLLNTGEESGKGNRLLKTAEDLLRKFEFLNFKGNVEPEAILRGEVDVAVCDGSLGNIMLKAAEAGANLVFKLIKSKITGLKANLGAWFLQSTFREIKEIISPAQYGGAPLLGVRGIVIIAHGHSNAEAIKNALGAAQAACQHQLIKKLEKKLKEISL